MTRRLALLALWAVLMAPLAGLWWQAAAPDADVDALMGILRALALPFKGRCG